jgi:hypothetical protein
MSTVTIQVDATIVDSESALRSLLDTIFKPSCGSSFAVPGPRGSRHEIFNERPMKTEIVQYCAQDVTFLPELWKVYSAKLHHAGEAFWQVMMRRATEERIKLS